MEWNFRTAQLSDLDRVTEIEYICFPAEQAATRAAFEQRIKTFPSHFILLEHEGHAHRFCKRRGAGRTLY